MNMVYRILAMVLICTGCQIMTKKEDKEKVDTTKLVEMYIDSAEFYEYEVENFNVAIKYYDSALNVNNNKSWYNNRGCLKESNGDLDGALKDLDIAVANDPTFLENRSRVLYKLGR